MDIGRQYDVWSDFPNNPLNLLAGLNAVLGGLFLHAQPLYEDAPPQLQGRYQDTTYYLAPTSIVPLLVPLAAIPLIGMPLAKALDAPLRVLVETGYDRTINPGAPTAAQWLYFPNPVTTLVNFVKAIPTGWDDAIAYTSGDPSNRPFSTAPQPVYGVGGPPVDAGAVDPYGPSPSPSPVPSPSAAATVKSSRQGAERSATTSVRNLSAVVSATAAVPSMAAAAPRAGTADAVRPDRNSTRSLAARR